MKLLTTARRVLRWLGALIIGLPLLAYLILLAINWQDESPTEAALKLEALYKERPIPADQNNAYLYLMGFTAPVGENPTELGLKRVEWTRQAMQQTSTAELKEPEYRRFADYRSMRLNSLSELIEHCKQNDQQCTASLENDPELIEIWLRTEDFLLDRYLGLLKHTAMYEPLAYDVRFSFPEYQHLFDGQRLLLTRAWLSAKQGNATQVKQLLEEDLAFWRMALADADVLITKMVAANAIKQHFVWANRALQQFPAKQIGQAVPEQWKQPLTNRERSMMRALSGEAMFAKGTLKAIKAGETDWLASFGADSPYHSLIEMLGAPMFLEQMSVNRYAEFLLGLDKAFTVPYEQIPAAIEQAKSLQSAYVPGHIDLSLLRNLGTNLLLRFAFDIGYQDYFIRITDLEGTRRAALLISDMRRQAIPADAIADHLQHAELQNPYTQTPFSWDAESGAITFSSPGREETHALEY